MHFFGGGGGLNLTANYHIIIYFRLPFISLVRSSVELLKTGLEALVERSALGYPRLIHLITDILFRQV